MDQGLRVLSLLACFLAPPARAADSPAGEAGIKFFESKVRPILSEHCSKCHGPDSDEGEGELRVDSLDALLRGGESGPAIVRGDPGRSLLIRAVRHDGELSMPPKKKLAQHDIDALTAWVKMGAPWPDSHEDRKPAHNASGDLQWDERARNFWAFQLPRPQQPPLVVDSQWPRSPIDRFVLAKLEARGLRPAPSADKRTLLRRVTFDLWGIPPSQEENDAFLRDESADAFVRVVDRLLASPHYGERWGRHWLDLARYADSNGMDDNLAYTDAWRYRNYVIAAFNADKPYNRFVEEQLAGDVLAESEPDRRDELLVATGFLAVGPKMLAEDDPVKQQMDIVDEQLDTTCRTFMAITMGCARCHDHKFDPFRIADYYSLAGIFKSTRTMISFRVDSKWNSTALGGIKAALRLDDLEQIIDRHDNSLVNGNPKRMSADERAAHLTLLEEAKREYAAIPKAMSVAEGSIGDVEIFLRGNHLTRGPVAPRRFPTILAGTNQPALDPTHSGRLELARWMTSSQNPLSARVIVNRVWRWHFGQGLVRSVDNFGRLGQLPSHPELLDWLATRLVADGWSLKTLHKRILLSRVYKLSTTWNERASQLDPENRLLWHMPRRRMEVEELRDSLLAVSGQLDLTMGARSLGSEPFQNLSDGAASRQPALYQSVRRSVYLPVLRGALYDVFRTFDFPDPAVIDGDRATTTVAAQALFMMNSRLMGEASEHLARLLLFDSSLPGRDRLRLACRRVLGRSATADELAEWESFLERYQSAASLATESLAVRRRLAWQGLCRALLSSNEFVYIN
ncbi:MAG: PSD1 and planctomycete cytochrome C domain-containing protein [Isosphaerales bacterium]